MLIEKPILQFLSQRVCHSKAVRYLPPSEVCPILIAALFQEVEVKVRAGLGFDLARLFANALRRSAHIVLTRQTGIGNSSNLDEGGPARKQRLRIGVWQAAGSKPLRFDLQLTQ